MNRYTQIRTNPHRSFFGFTKFTRQDAALEAQRNWEKLGEKSSQNFWAQQFRCIWIWSVGPLQLATLRLMSASVMNTDFKTKRAAANRSEHDACVRHATNFSECPPPNWILQVSSTIKTPCVCHTHALYATRLHSSVTFEHTHTRLLWQESSVMEPKRTLRLLAVKTAEHTVWISSNHSVSNHSVWQSRAHAGYTRSIPQRHTQRWSTPSTILTRFAREREIAQIFSAVLRRTRRRKWSNKDLDANEIINCLNLFYFWLFQRIDNQLMQPGPTNWIRTDAFAGDLYCDRTLLSISSLSPFTTRTEFTEFSSWRNLSWRSAADHQRWLSRPSLPMNGHTEVCRLHTHCRDYPGEQKRMGQRWSLN